MTWKPPLPTGWGEEFGDDEELAILQISLPQGFHIVKDKGGFEYTCDRPIPRSISYR